MLLLLWLYLFIFLELFLHSSPVAYWAPTDLGSSSFSVLSFCLFIVCLGFSRQEYWSSLPFPSPVDHILSELSTMTHLSWVALHEMAHCFIELDKAVVHVISLISFLWCGFHSVCPLRNKDKRLMEASWWERLRGKLDLVLMGGAMLSKSLIQFSVDEWSCVPSLLFTWGHTMVAQRVKGLPTMGETWVQSLGWKDPLEKEMATHSSTLSWKIPWTEKPGRLYRPWGHKESDTTEQLNWTDV